MSVYTIITRAEVDALLRQYDIGELEAYTPIKEGVTNSIYKLSTSDAEFVLTIFEALTDSELPFFINLTESLYREGLPCPQVMSDKRGKYIQHVQEKAAIISEFLPGRNVTEPTIKQCSIVGSTLANLHLKTQNFKARRSNPFTLQWHENLAADLREHLAPNQLSLLNNELSHQQAQHYAALPRGIIHMDLFPDNVLFDGDQLTGLLDFYFACNDHYLLDLAVAMNAWSLKELSYQLPHAEALLAAYQSVRPLEHDEAAQLKNMQRYAALHFWLTRLRDYHLVAAQENVLVKDPRQFEELLRQHISGNLF
jgi:homoserine kinase type II